MSNLPTRRQASMALGSWLGLAASTTHLAVDASTVSQDQAAWAALRSGGHVLLIRHARAPGTFDPPEFKLDECSTQRNLNDEGRAQAKRLGELVRAMNVPVHRVLSSEWCRCVETAQLAFGADAVSTDKLLSSPTQLSAQQRIKHTQLIREEIKLYTLNKTKLALRPNLAMVTHMFNIQDITGENVAEGEILVVTSAESNSKNPMRVIGRVSTT